mmetsp:Transcript_4624/g.10153  ORF Transcript_4624/g.10153 Transcript_4624/m.10153 type:complete len:495 (+) Transcript_4624:75-1559(+)
MSDTDDSEASTSVPEATPEQLAKSEEFKAKANKFFQEGHLKEAVEQYSLAIELNGRNHILYANRAFCHVKIENYGSAIVDATEAITLDPTYIKGYYRRGTAYLALTKLKQAKADFREACKIEPNNKDARLKLAECEKAIKKERFEAAIGSDAVGGAAASSGVDPDTIEVESSYTGPAMEEGQVTVEFVDELTEWMKAERKLHKKYAFQILYKVRDVLKAEKTVVDVPVPAGEHITVCGDVHGQFYDLLNIFDLNGKPSTSNPYLFNGDFVDRGSFSMETILLLFAYKCLYPEHFHLNRGNHESVNMNKMYGFEGEVASKHGRRMYECFCLLFCYLPLAFTINSKVFICHGGLFREDGITLADINAVDRVLEPPDQGIVCDILWSDPQDANGRAASKRGTGCMFGPDVTNKFLEDNNLTLLVRSHEMKEDGYDVQHGGKCITIFSAPNYCDQMGNLGAYIRFGADCLPRFFRFSASPHPAVAPMAYAPTGMAGLM